VLRSTRGGGASGEVRRHRGLGGGEARSHDRADLRVHARASGSGRAIARWMIAMFAAQSEVELSRSCQNAGKTGSQTPGRSRAGGRGQPSSPDARVPLPISRRMWV
jgi:hypothetical protein